MHWSISSGSVCAALAFGFGSNALPDTFLYPDLGQAHDSPGLCPLVVALGSGVNIKPKSHKKTTVTLTPRIQIHSEQLNEGVWNIEGFLSAQDYFNT